MINSAKIIAVVVTYYPSLDALKILLEATFPQVSEIVVIDNTPQPDNSLLGELSQMKNLNFISLNENMGIAYAQNIGIEYAIKRSADCVLLLDQDSVPFADMVSKLLAKFQNGSEKIAAVAPVTIDSRTKIKSYFMVSKFGFPFRYKPTKIPDAALLVNTGFVISSGSLISLRAILDLGGKRSGYFIDHVDTEWCLRARNFGYKLVGVHDAFLNHSLGDEVKLFWLFYTRYIPYHTPLRDYYMFRNTISCLRDIKGMVIWKFLLVSRLFQFCIYFLVFAPERLNRAHLILLGLYHGLIKKDGRFDVLSKKCTPIPKTTLDPR
jgi:rhamnosyltransferase